MKDPVVLKVQVAVIYNLTYTSVDFRNKKALLNHQQRLKTISPEAELIRDLTLEDLPDRVETKILYLDSKPLEDPNRTCPVCFTNEVHDAKCDWKNDPL